MSVIDSNSNFGALLHNISKLHLYNLMNSSQIIHLLPRLARVINEGKASVWQLAEALSESQILSKKWLVDECCALDLNLKNITLCAGWYGTLFWDQRLKYILARSFDIDPHCEIVANIIHHPLIMQDWKFIAATFDIYEIGYDAFTFVVHKSDGSDCILTYTTDTIINTSCEHLEYFDLWYSKLPPGKLLILQSNDGYQYPDHTNCVRNLSEFSRLTPMTEVLFSGQRKMPHFNRFMRIGYR
jgi:hypothetical protein